MFFIYILKSLKDNKFYIGQTKNLEDRVQRHYQGREKATKNRRPFELVYTEEYKTRTEAIKRESYLKSLKSHNHLEELMKRWRGGSSTG